MGAYHLVAIEIDDLGSKVKVTVTEYESQNDEKKKSLKVQMWKSFNQSLSFDRKFHYYNFDAKYDYIVQ